MDFDTIEAEASALGLSQRKVEDLLARYVHTIDDDRLEEWPDLFAAECSYNILPARNREAGMPIGYMYCASQGMLRDRVTALRKANIYEPQRYRHMLGAVRMLGTEAGAVCVQSSVTVTRIMESGDLTLFSTGKYLDRVVVENGQPRFREKLVILDSECLDSLLVIPL